MRIVRTENISIFFILFSAVVILQPFAELYAADVKHDFATVASPVVITGQAQDHDIVSYHTTEDVYKVSGSFADESMFGVIVDDPVLYLESEVAFQEGARPVVRYGEALVNVSTLGGEIHAGDIITTSPISGVGQKAEFRDAPYILGFALDRVSYTGETMLYDGKEVQLGTVPTALRIGPYLTKEGVAFVTAGKEHAGLFENFEQGFFQGSNNDTKVPEVINAFKVFRYFLAALIAMTAIIISIGRFGEAFKEGVVSVGRNPLARSQIRMILFWNVILIILVSGAGLGVAAVILFIP